MPRDYIKQELLTAEEAVELSGIESTLLVIDTDMREQCELGNRVYFLKLEIVRRTTLDDVCKDLSERGFNVERQVNPFAVKVHW